MKGNKNEDVCEVEKDDKEIKWRGRKPTLRAHPRLRQKPHAVGLESSTAAAATYAVPKWLAALTGRVTSRRVTLQQFLANNFGVCLLRSLRAALYHEARHTQDNAY